MKFTKMSVLWILLLLPAAASAHPQLMGDSTGLVLGLAHPFTGADHLLAMLAVGLWAAHLGGDATWKVPTAFVVMLVIGALLAVGGVQLPLTEPLIATSVLTMGLLLVLAMRASALAGTLLVGLFALFHGQAHGVGLPLLTAATPFLLGMVVASVSLHLLGLALGRSLHNRLWLLRSSGALMAGAGLWMVAGA